MSLEDRRTTRQERKRRIENAATALFAKRGYASTTVDDIARAAGFTKPMVYRDFDSKRELCATLLERHRDDLVRSALDVYDPGASDRPAQLRKLFAAWFDHVRKCPDAVRMVYLPIFGDPETARARDDLPPRESIAPPVLLDELTAGGDPAEAEARAEVVGASLGALGLWWLDHPDTPRDVLVEVMVRMTEGLLGPATP